MADLEIKGGPSVANASAKNKTVTLTFSTAEELTLFADLEADAEADERTLSKYLVRLLKSSVKSE